MRLLLLDQFSEPGGAQRCLLDLLPAIRARGWQALVGLPGEGELFARVRAEGFETARIDCGPYRSGRKSAADTARFLAQTPRLSGQIHLLAGRVQADLVYVNGPRLLPAASLAGLSMPVLFHAHSYLGPGAMRRLAGISLRRMRATVVANCRFVGEPWKEYADEGRVSLIYNGTARRLPARGRAETFATIGCLGRISPEKGQREFLRAAAIIHRSIPQCRFLIGGATLFTGTAYEEDVRRAAGGLPVEFTGWIKDVDPFFGRLSILLVPSAAHEAIPRVILEAFAAGVPVIAFASGGIPEAIENGVDGFLAHSVDEMAALAVQLLSGGSDRLAAVARAGYETWRRRFMIERYQAEILATIEAAVGTAPPPQQPDPPRQQ
jgi:glycosyltransferase involved in cell wall biosynthesis